MQGNLHVKLAITLVLPDQIAQRTDDFAIVSRRVQLHADAGGQPLNAQLDRQHIAHQQAGRFAPLVHLPAQENDLLGAQDSWKPIADVGVRLREAHPLDLPFQVFQLENRPALPGAAAALGHLRSHRREHPADQHFGPLGAVGGFACGGGGIALDGGLVLGQRMAGDVEAEQLLFKLEQVGAGQLGNVGKGDRALAPARWRSTGRGSLPEHRHLPRPLVVLMLLAHLDRPFQHVQQL